MLFPNVIAMVLFVLHLSLIEETIVNLHQYAHYQYNSSRIGQFHLNQIHLQISIINNFF